MKALKIIGIILGTLLGLWLIGSLLSPAHLHVERSQDINAPQQLVFDNVNTITKWPNWSYWMKQDTAQTVTYSGPESGVGASYAWDSKKLKQGSLTVIESTSPSKLKFDLVFGGMGGNISVWTFEPQPENSVKVTQSFDQDLPFHFRLMGALMMKPQFGKAFEEDLKNLKAYTESLPATPAVSMEQVDVPAQWVIAVRDTAKAAEMSATFPMLYGNLVTYLQTKKASPAGYALAVWYNVDQAADYYEFEAGFPITDSIAPGKGMRVFKLGGSKALKATHWGDYDAMMPTYEAIEAHLKQNNLTPSGPTWEVYVTDPMTEKDTAKWQTDIYYPL